LIILWCLATVFWLNGFLFFVIHPPRGTDLFLGCSCFFNPSWWIVLIQRLSCIFYPRVIFFLLMFLLRNLNLLFPYIFFWFFVEPDHFSLQ
jgi:hypothetical protein